MATIEGARVVGREDEIGSLEVGKKADFFIFNPRNVACVPVADPITCLVYSANPTAIETVVIHGAVVMENGVICSMDEAQAVDALQESAYRLRQRVGLGKERVLNVYSDSRYAFATAHVHGAIYQHRGLLTSAGTWAPPLCCSAW